MCNEIHKIGGFEEYRSRIYGKIFCAYFSDFTFKTTHLCIISKYIGLNNILQRRSIEKNSCFGLIFFY